MINEGKKKNLFYIFIYIKQESQLAINRFLLLVSWLAKSIKFHSKIDQPNKQRDQNCPICSTVVLYVGRTWC